MQIILNNLDYSLNINKIESAFRTNNFYPPLKTLEKPFFDVKSISYIFLEFLKTSIWCGSFDFKGKITTTHISSTGLSTDKLHKNTQFIKNNNLVRKSILQPIENKGTIHDKS